MNIYPIWNTCMYVYIHILYIMYTLYYESAAFNWSLSKLTIKKPENLSKNVLTDFEHNFIATEGKISALNT